MTAWYVTLIVILLGVCVLLPLIDRRWGYRIGTAVGAGVFLIVSLAYGFIADDLGATLIRTVVLLPLLVAVRLQVGRNRAAKNASS